ncbi:Rieske (2Fe-2S) protein [Desulfuromonas carbonis]
MDNLEVSPARRRFFLTVILGGVGAVLAGAAGWPQFRFLSPSKGEGEGGKTTIGRDKVPVGGAHFFNFHGHPAVVVQPQPGQFIALTAVCTHLGCIVKWEVDKGDFLCPCHGGRYSPDGQVTAGPPPKPLESYAVQIQGDQLLVG